MESKDYSSRRDGSDLAACTLRRDLYSRFQGPSAGGNAPWIMLHDGVLLHRERPLPTEVPSESWSYFTHIASWSQWPQGRLEAKRRALAMVEQMDKEGFGNCSNTGACEVECPKQISLEHIARLNREYLAAAVTKE